MYARVVRFTDIVPEQIRARIESGEGPPPGVNANSVQLVVDNSQSTAVVIIFFETEEDMRSADEALNAMDSGDTPGTRASVDMGEVDERISAG
jgi:hypothetical protein